MPTSVYPASTGSHINWGGVLKGVALVSAVAIAAVGAAAVIGAVAGPGIAALTGTTFGSLLAGGISVLGQALTTAIGWGAWAAGNVYGLWLQLPSLLHITSTLTTGTVGSTVGLLTTGAKVAGGAAAGAVVAHAIKPSLDNLQLTTPHIPPINTANSGLQATMAAASGTHAMHTMAHMSHHAAEHENNDLAPGEQPRNWVSRMADKAGITGQATVPPSIAPRDANFASQLNADRAALDAALDTPQK